MLLFTFFMLILNVAVAIFPFLARNVNATKLEPCLKLLCSLSSSKALFYGNPVIGQSFVTILFMANVSVVYRGSLVFVL